MGLNETKSSACIQLLDGMAILDYNNMHGLNWCHMHSARSNMMFNQASHFRPQRRSNLLRRRRRSPSQRDVASQGAGGSVTTFAAVARTPPSQPSQKGSWAPRDAKGGEGGGWYSLRSVAQKDIGEPQQYDNKYCEN